MADEDDDDYEDDAEAEGGGQGKKGGKKKLLLLILLPLLLVIGGVAGAYFAGLMDPVLAMFGGSETAGDTPSAEGDGGHGGEGGAGGEGAPGGAVFYDLDQNSSGRRRSYLQMRLSLQLEHQLDVPVVEEAMPRIMDNFITFLRELRLEDLQGTAGMYRIQEELLIRVNNAAAPARVKDVLFKEMLIQ
jgi:flagellar FliL protein